MYNSNEAQDIRDLATQVHDCWRNIYTIKIIPKGSHFFIILVIIFSYSFWYYMICVLYLVLCASIVWYICLIGFVHTFFVCLLWRPQMMSWVLLEPRTVVLVFAHGYPRDGEKNVSGFSSSPKKSRTLKSCWNWSRWNWSLKSFSDSSMNNREIDTLIGISTVDRLMVGWIDG
jgi:hypothetical protein